MLHRVCIIGGLLLCGCGFASSNKDALAYRYDRYVSMLVSEVTLHGPVAGANLLRTFVEMDPPIADLCHGLSHELGEAAYATVGLIRALELEDDVCGSGYVHGVIEAHLTQVPDLEAALFSLCAPDAAKCFHGLGHGLMDRSGNDLPESLRQCGRFLLPHQRNQCAEGVFMENFDANGAEHASEYLLPDDIYFPCRGQSSAFEGVCALYAPRYFLRLHAGDYEGVAQWCRTAVPEGPRDACMKGLGEAVMKQHILEPLFAERICNETARGYEDFCIEGLVSYYVVHHASIVKGRALCTLLSGSSQKICVREVSESERFYGE